MAKIYLASSWRNLSQPFVLKKLRDEGHEVYDFRNPKPGENGFAWTEIDEEWESWTTPEFIRALEHPIADKGYGFDKRALDWCDTCVCLLPCGKSAHLEAGYTIGQGKPTYFLIYDGATQPELMYKLGTDCIIQISVLLNRLNEDDRQRAKALELFRNEP